MMISVWVKSETLEFLEKVLSFREDWKSIIFLHAYAAQPCTYKCHTICQPILFSHAYQDMKLDAVDQQK